MTEASAPAAAPALASGGPAPAHIAQNNRAVSVPVTRVMVVQLVEVTQITNISILESRFTAQFYIELRIDGGALDPDLSAPGDAFPLDANGKPTFLPPAGWYVKQFDFNNAVSYQQLDGRTFVRGEDIILALRYEGVFLESMELQNFPFDVQDLSMSLAINCRTSGMMPVELRIDPRVKSRHVIEDKHFTLHNEWQLRREVALELKLVGTDDRIFPTVEITPVVERKPHFYLVNIAFPMALFALMGNFQFTLPRYSTPDRFNVCFSLLLTVVAFRFSISTMLPNISYLTILDVFSLGCSVCICLACFEAGLQGAVLMHAAEQVFDQHTRHLDDPFLDELDDAEDSEALAPIARMLKAAKAKRSGGEEQAGEEAIRAEVSRSMWFRRMDTAFLVLNVVLLGSVVLHFIRSSAVEKRSASENEREERESASPKGKRSASGAAAAREAVKGAALI